MRCAELTFQIMVGIITAIGGKARLFFVNIGLIVIFLLAKEEKGGEMSKIMTD